jgi:putative ABC transport system permease protein
MDFVALKMLMGDRLKYVGLVAGVAFAALLITQQASIFMGFAGRSGNWIASTSYADLWVMDPQVRFSEDIKPMSDTALQRVRGVEGVGWAVPMYKGYLRGRLGDGTQITLRIVGLDDATLAGGPPHMVHGHLSDLRRDRAVIVNHKDLGGSLALDAGTGQAMRVGDRMSIRDNDAVVVGTYAAPDEFFWEPLIYTTYSRALQWAPPDRRMLGFVLVKVAEGQDIAAVARRIESVTGLKALTNEQFRRLTIDYIIGKTGILVNFGITIALGFVIGVLVAGQTFYTFVLDNLRQFAALKAMGTGNATVMRMLVLQVIVVGLIGYGIGVGAAAMAGTLLTRIGLAFQMPWQVPVFGGVAVILCCLGAGALSMLRVMRLEPAIVFK